MKRPLPDRPSLEQLKSQAKELLATLRLDDASAKLGHAQHLIAKQYGFAAWQNLHAHVNELTDQKLKELAQTFRKFAAVECRGRSPSYECWANHIAEDRELLRIAAFGRTPIPNLFFAALHLLVLTNPTCDLARHYTSVDDNPLSPETGWIRFRKFCLINRDTIVRLMRARATQTNEVRRSAYLAAAFSIVWRSGGKKPLALVEIGTSAGLNLCWDHYAFKIGESIFGNANAALLLDVEARGEIVPPIPQRQIPVGQRIGIDLRPITAGDSEGVEWLNALIWPEHRDRRRELDTALQIAANIPRQLIAGDAVAILDGVLHGLSPDCTACVFQTHSFNQIPAPGREKLQATMKDFAKTRPLYFVSRHDRLTLDCFGNSTESQSILAETDAHGRWIEWLAPGDVSS